MLITFESDWEKAKKILLEIVDRHAHHLTKAAERKVIEAGKRLMLVGGTLTPTVYTSVKESGVLLTLRYLTQPRQRRGSQQAVWEDILRDFAKCDDIEFAYPTQRFFNNAAEGKSPLKSPRATGDADQSSDTGSTSTMS